MEGFDWSSVIPWILAIAATAWGVYLKVSGKTEGEDAKFFVQLAEAQKVASDAVAAAEQLWQSGQIEKGERLDAAYAWLKPYFPNLPKETLVMSIEAAVFWLKQGLGQVTTSDAA